MLLLLAMLLTLSFTAPARAGDCCRDPIAGGEGTVLFLTGPDPAEGALHKDYPVGGSYDSVSILPDGGVMRQELGVWESEPLVYDWTVDSLIDIQIPAWGNGYSASTTFYAQILLDGEGIGAEMETASDGMMPHFMYWLTNGTFKFTAKAGQRIGVSIAVLENGPGGEMRWDSEEALARVWIETPSLTIEVEDVPIGSRHESRLDVFSHWGEGDIDDIDMLVIDLDRMNGGPMWDDIKNNATLYETSDGITYEWDDSEAEEGHRYGFWAWEMPDDAPERLEVVGFANDGGRLPTFTSDSATRGETTEPKDEFSSSSSSEDEVPWTPIIGFMIVAGLGIAGYERKVMEHDMKKVVAVAGTVVLAGILIMAGFYSAAFSTDKQEAPEFELETIDGDSVALSELEDKVVVLSFSGIYCSFCGPQMEEMVKVREEFRDNDEVFFLSVNIMAGDDDEDWREFRDELGADWPFAMDNDQMVAKFKITSMPVIILIDKEGDIVYTNHDSLLKAGKFADKIEAAEEGEATGGVTFTGGSLMFAFFVGITAFFAPCAFPLLPGFMTYQLGQMDGAVDEDGYYYEDEDREPPGVMKGLKMGIAALIGITAVMAVFAILGWLLEDFIQSNMEYYTVALGAIIVILGVVFLLHIPLPTAGIGDWLRSRSFYTNRVAPKVEGWLGEDASVSSRHLGVMAYGAGYASASMGCHGPIFIAVVLIGLAGGFMLTLEMVLLYALGMGICMIAVCILVAMAEDTLVEKLQDNLKLINKISGLFLIIAGIWIFWFGYQAFL